MKKILLICLLFSFKSYAQDLSGINVNLTLRGGDWCFIVGSIQPDADSLSIVYKNRIRDTMLLANPATMTTNVRFNSIPATLVYNIYLTVRSLPATLYDQVGNNISNQVKAIVSTPLQTAITNYDNISAGVYLNVRRRGKNFLSDH